MTHFWSVSQTKLVVEKPPGIEPLLIGQRVLDSLFLSVLGGICAIPEIFDCQPRFHK